MTKMTTLDILFGISSPYDSFVLTGLEAFTHSCSFKVAVQAGCELQTVD